MNMDIIAPQSAVIVPEKFQVALIENVSTALLKEIAPPCLLRARPALERPSFSLRCCRKLRRPARHSGSGSYPFVNLVQQTGR